MLDLGQGPQSRLGWPMGSRGQRRIFCVNPPKKRAALFGIWRDQSDSSRRWEERDVRGINNLKYIKAKRVQHR